MSTGNVPNAMSEIDIDTSCTTMSGQTARIVPPAEARRATTFSNGNRTNITENKAIPVMNIGRGPKRAMAGGKTAY
jgi:hypothetical protein